MKKIDKIIIDILKKEEHPIPKGIIIKKIEEQDNSVEKPEIFKSLKWLLSNGNIKELINGKIVIGYQDGNIIEGTNGKGTIKLNSSCDGFVKDSEGNSICYINKKNLNSSLDGDEVEFILFDKKTKDDLNDGTVLKVLKREKITYTAVFYKNDKGNWFELDDQKIYQKVFVEDVNLLTNGMKVLLKFDEISQNFIKASVIKIIGNINDVGNDIISVVYDYGVEPEFSNEVLSYTNSIDFTISKNEIEKRKDLRNLNFITIDPRESKDLDDSICLQKEGDLYRLWVSIADVAHYVRPDTILDKEAFNRSTSIYLVDKVIPMLPHILSNDVCSLNPNEDRLVMTCEMLIDKLGNIKYSDVYESVINSKKRYAYDDVNAFFNSNYNEENAQLKKMLEESYELYKILRMNFEKRGYIDFDVAEPKIILDQKGKVTDVKLRDRGDAQMMIENFMVAANEAATFLFNDKKIKFIYRVHDKPSEKKIKSFQVECKKIGFKVDGEINNIKSNSIARWIEMNQGYSHSLFSRILLKTMSKAEYSIENIGHFGLASPRYTHFTSPIRRYPDVIVHRMYKMFFLRRNEYTDIQRNSLLNNLEFICKQTSEREQRAVQIERDVNSLKFAEFMESKIGCEYNGIVSHITSFGIFVELENTIEGLCRIKNIKVNDYFIYNEQENIFVGEKTKKIITFGNVVKIKVIGANMKSKQIDFEILEFLG